MVLDIDLTNGDLNTNPGIFQSSTIESGNLNPTNPQNILPDIPKKKSNWPRILLFILVGIALGGIGYFLYKSSQISKELGFKFNIGEVVTTKKPELKKDTTGRYTNVLFVGVDSRESSYISNTDTIMVGSYNHQTKDITMISIPRDFYVITNPQTKWVNRINTVYAAAENAQEGEGFPALISSVKDVTNLEIQYYAMVDFKAFTQIIDTVGGIDINVENSFTDYNYLDSTTVSFTAGPQTMDGETALKYARSRKSLDNGEGTDYARARRQQKVISALQEKILSTDTLSNPKTLIQILSSLSNNIKVSEFTQDDIVAALAVGKDMLQNGNKHYSFVLDPASGNSQLVEIKGDPNVEYTIGQKLGLGMYDDIHEYVD